MILKRSTLAYCRFQEGGGQTDEEQLTRRHNILPRRVFIDLECGGLDPKRHPIIQIAAIAFDSEWEERERFEVKLKFDEADCDPEALKKICYDRRLWALHAVEPLTAHHRLSYFLREHATIEKTSRAKQVPYHLAQLFAHNAPFDSAFLWHWHDSLRSEHHGLFLPADHRIICTLQTALIFFDQDRVDGFARPDNFQLGTLCEYFGIPFSVNEAHDAAYDAVATALLYHAITTGNEHPIELGQAA